MLQEAERRGWVTADALEAPAEGVAQGQDLGGTDVGEISALDVAPDLLDRIELWSIDGEPFHLFHESH